MQYIITDRARDLGEELEVSFAPTRAKEGDAGFDLRACLGRSTCIAPGEVFKIPLGVKIYLGDHPDPTKKWAGLLMLRSSNDHLTLTNGVGLLDSGYQGEIMAKVVNCRNDPIYINPADRIIQLVIIEVSTQEMTQVDLFEEITDRAGGGFGSTGSNAIDLWSLR